MSRASGSDDAGAYHAWTVPSLTPARFYPEYVIMKNCPLILPRPDRSMLPIDGQTKPLDQAFFGKGIMRGDGRKALRSSPAACLACCGMASSQSDLWTGFI